jgi:hypothetical protein
MLGLVDSGTIEQVFLSSGDAIRAIGEAMMSSTSIVMRTIGQVLLSRSYSSIMRKLASTD